MVAPFLSPLRRLLLFVIVIGCVAGGPAAAQAQPAEADAPAVTSPSEFLGYELGTRFTPHHRVVDYVRHVAATSPRVQVEQYGTTVEDRPLLLAVIAAPERMERIDEVRRTHRRRAGIEDADPVEEAPADAPAVVWLSYNVHGNESVSTEAALQVLHDFADSQNAETTAYLEDSVVLLDPCLNPDGRERYVQWYKRMVGDRANARPEAREHHEPWPGGRSNHYYFDLNRDWAWGVQAETRQRLEAYHRWMPHVHVDYHEMGVDDPYYFAPAAEPYHEDITAWQREFQSTIGEANAAAFDRNGWLYFTRQVFDLVYPGYGDTWPIFNGAIGMTYEQGGSGRAGRAVITAEGDTLTLADRIAHHHATSLATVEATVQNRERVVEAFAEYYRTAREDPPGRYEAYVIHRDDGGDRLHALAEHLDRQRIEYGIAAETATREGIAYHRAETGEEDVRIRPGDLVVNVRQPKARLAKVLLEPQTTLTDSLTYDITAWGLPYVYGLDAAALTEAADVPTRARVPSSEPLVRGDTSGTGPAYAYLARWSSRADVRFAADLWSQGLMLRFTRTPFTLGGERYAAGTLLITRSGNAGIEDWDAVVRRTARRHGQPVRAVQTGRVESGPDFGSSNIGFVNAPHVAALAGPPAASSSVGEVWHFFDRQIDYPVTLLPTEDFASGMLDEVDVLVMPDGAYGDWLSDDRRAALVSWVQAGGRLVAIGGANEALAGHRPFTLQRASTDSADADGKAADEESAADGEPSEASLRRYGDRERERLDRATPGSIHRVRADTTHPLGFGLSDPLYTLKRSRTAYAYLDDGWTVAALETGEPVSGFMGSTAQKKLEKTLVYGTEDVGDGEVVYLVDNPLFRGFWYRGQVVFSNAVFLVGN